MIPRERPANPRNWCSNCDADFTSVSGFDEHRVGKHAYPYDEEHPDGRRCLDHEELEALGYVQDEQDRWFHLERTALLSDSPGLSASPIGELTFVSRRASARLR